MTQWKYFPDTTPPRGLPLRLEVKEKDQNTGTPEPYFGKTLFQGFAVFDGRLHPVRLVPPAADFLGRPAKRLWA